MIIAIVIILSNITILLNIAFIRQFFGFIFLTILPGLLIIQILKLNRLDFFDRLTLVCGLSVSFTMLFGLLINNLSLKLGYLSPLSTISILVSFDLAFMILAVFGYTAKKEFLLYLPNLHLNVFEKMILIIAIIFPELSIFGTDIMNETNNNILLLLLLFLIPACTLTIVLMNNRLSERIYPVVIFLISVSLLLMVSLRSHHIMGIDEHYEFRLYQSIFDAGYWSIIEKDNMINTCLSVTLLPAIYQSLLRMKGEYIFKILYALFFSFSPVIIYIISKKYISPVYAFLSSFFFMSYPLFFFAELNFRTRIAVVFFALAIMVLFHDRISEFNKKLLFILFALSCIESHYSTAYIFLIMLFLAWIVTQIIPIIASYGRMSLALAKESPMKDNMQNDLNKRLTITTVILFFVMLFFWSGMATDASFGGGINFIQTTFVNLNRFFMLESRGMTASDLIGTSTAYSGIPQKIELLCSRLSLVLIAIGVLSTIYRYRIRVSISNLEYRIDKEYFSIAIASSLIAASAFILPYVAVGYSLSRSFQQMFIVLSLFFAVGCITVEKQLKTRTYLIILIVLIPYFICSSGLAYYILDIPKSITLNSMGFDYDYLYIHDQESSSGKWLQKNGELRTMTIYTDTLGKLRLVSQTSIPTNFIDNYWLVDNDKKIKKGYIYLRYYNVVNSKLADRKYVGHDIVDYRDKFIGKSKIMSNGGSEIYN